MVEGAREEENEEGKETDFIEGEKGGGKEAQNQMKGRDECVLSFGCLACLDDCLR